MKDAMKSKRSSDLATIRLILAAVKDRDIAAREHGVQDAQATAEAAKKAIKAVGAEGIKDMGKVMAHLRQTHGASLDPQTAAEAAKRLLTSA